MIQTRETLYGVSSTGKIKQWTVFTDGGEVVVEYGYIDGKKQTKRYKAKAKNVGKANETTPEQQAILEAKSKWEKQYKTKLYRPTIEEARVTNKLLPMLAHDYRKRSHKIKYPCDCQPKLDGVRGMAYVSESGTVECISRTGEQYGLHAKLETELKILFDETDFTLNFDGELYDHDKLLQEIVSDVRNTRDNVKFYIFDIAVKGLTWEERAVNLMMVKGLVDFYGMDHIRVVLPDLVHSEDKMKEVFAEYIEMGYEGVMIRNLHGEYAFGRRSVDLQKYKEFFDEEFEIVGVEVDKNDQGVLVCDCDVFNAHMEKKTFKVRMRGKDEVRKDIADNPENYIGKKVTVKYQQLSEECMPIFPVGIAIRDYE